MASTLPGELIDEIMSNLHPDPGETKSALRACTVVSRAWRPLAQAHLFRHIYLTLRALPLGEQLNNTLCLHSSEEYAQDKPRTLNAFVEFLRQHAHHGASIRQLQLYQGLYRGASLEDCRFSAVLFTSLLQLIPNVRQLYLCAITLHPPGGPALPIHRPSLTRLELSYPGTTPTIPDLDVLLRCFERVAELTLRVLDDIHRPAGSRIPHLLPPAPIVERVTLESVELERGVSDAIWESMDLSSIQSLRIVPSYASIAAYAEFLEKAGPRLRRLELYIYTDDERLDELCQYIPLCKALEQLLIEIDFDYSDEGSQLDELCNFLSSIWITADRYPKLCNIVFVFHALFEDTNDDEYSAGQLGQRMDETLINIILQSHVVKVDFIWREGRNPHGASVEAFLRKMFPRLLERNFLQLRYIGPSS